MSPGHLAGRGDAGPRLDLVVGEIAQPSQPVILPSEQPKRAAFNFMTRYMEAMTPTRSFSSSLLSAVSAADGVPNPELARAAAWRA